MTTKFTASNGVEIEITEIGGIFAKSVYGHIQDSRLPARYATGYRNSETYIRLQRTRSRTR